MGWFSRGESIALGWTLLHFCWQGAAVALTFALADRLTLRASSAVRYSVAAAALILMPLLVIGTFLREMRIAGATHTDATVSGKASAILDRIEAQPVSQQFAAAFALPVHDRGYWLADNTERVLPWLDALWMAGVLLLAMRAMGGWRQLERLRYKAQGIVPAHVERSFQSVCERVKAGRQVALRISDKVISPMAMGVWQATVILPMSAVMNLTTEELEAVLAHELGHIRRWDYAWNLLQTAVETVLFFHPAVWWLSRKVRDRREICCDEIAVASCADPIIYAQTLLRLEEQKITGLRLAVAQRGSSGSLLSRIKKVLGEDEPMESRITGGVRVAVAGLIVFGLLLGPRVTKAVAASLPVAKADISSMQVNATAKVTENAEVAVTNRTSVSKVDAQTAVATQSEVAVSPTVEIASGDGQAASEPAQGEAKPAGKGVSYIDGMRDAGYPLDLNNDLNELISLKSLGVTPEYAKQMGSLGFGKPSVHELLSLKALGVTPEYVAELKQSGIGPKDFHEVTTEKALGITPEYAAAMKKTDFGDLKLQDLISLKAQGVTPEYVGWLKHEFPQITMEELKRAAVFHLDDKFLAQAKSHGFDGKDVDKLLRLKMSGLLDE
jgi:beta-lactamase regulating signal transducer with metallopeptidase domain